MKKTILAAFLLSTAPLLSVAANYNSFVPSESEVTFSYQQMGVSLNGEFNEFNGSLNFDTENPQSASATVSIPLASVDTGSAEGDEEVAGKAWFNLQDFPTAEFESTNITPLDDGSFEVSGNLSIKGTSKPIVFPATFSEGDGQAKFEGKFTIQRGDFSIGEGMWAKHDIVANDVTIHFVLSAQSN